jgi:hypothetical protein
MLPAGDGIELGAFLRREVERFLQLCDRMRIGRATDATLEGAYCAKA